MKLYGKRERRKLNTPPPARASGFQISPDAGRVLYIADQDTNEVDELYSVPIDGSEPPVKVSAPLVANGDVQTGLRFSPDGNRDLYLADAEGRRLDVAARGDAVALRRPEDSLSS